MCKTVKRNSHKASTQTVVYMIPIPVLSSKLKSCSLQMSLSAKRLLQPRFDKEGKDISSKSNMLIALH